MALKQRQAFLLKLLNDKKLRAQFARAKTNTFPLSGKDFTLLKAIDPLQLERKAMGLQRKLQSTTEGQQ